MRSASFITINLLSLAVVILALAVSASARNLAVLSVADSATSHLFLERFESAVAARTNVVNREVATSAMSAVAPPTVINMTASEARSLGAAIGCNGFFLIWSDVYRRSLYDRKEYYDAFAAVYAVSSRTGRLVDFQLVRVEDDSRQRAVEALMRSAQATAALMIDRLMSEPVSPTDILTADRLEILPEDPTRGRMPIPFRRIRPEPTEISFLYDVEATVEVIVDLAADGTIRSADIYRWAGFGLDEAAIRAIRSMNWRPAEVAGRPTASRFIVRYNFKKLPRS